MENDCNTRAYIHAAVLDEDAAADYVNQLVVFFLVFSVAKVIFISLLKKGYFRIVYWRTLIAVIQTTKESGRPEVYGETGESITTSMMKINRK